MADRSLPDQCLGLLATFLSTSGIRKGGCLGRDFHCAEVSVGRRGGVGIDLTTVKGEQGKVCGRMTDKVVAIPVWGASAPAATLSLVLPQPAEAFLNGGVVAGQSTVAQKKKH